MPDTETPPAGIPTLPGAPPPDVPVKGSGSGGWVQALLDGVSNMITGAEKALGLAFMRIGIGLLGILVIAVGLVIALWPTVSQEAQQAGPMVAAAAA